MNKVKAYLFLISSFVLLALCVASVVALVRSFFAQDHLAAVESIVGTLVLIACLLMFGLKSLTLGKSMLAGKVESKDNEA